MAEEYINEGYRREIRRGHLDGYTNTRILPALAHIKGESILDLGCGLGAVANHINNREYFGIDYSPVAIEYAKEHNENPNADFKLGRFKETPNKKYDTVLLLEVLEHVAQPKLLAAFALERAQKCVIVTVPINMACRGHIHPCWTWDDLEKAVGELAVRQIIEPHWRLVVRYIP